MPSAIEALDAAYDLVVVGGGITGAGILREAVRTGARVLLVEQGDFASGTSSASSKLVHGGLRYLGQGHWRLTRESVRERQRLLAEAPGLVQPQAFLLPVYRDFGPGPWLIRLGLAVYDRMAGGNRFRSRWLDAGAMHALEPDAREDALRGAMLYQDARTDDARLVLRLIFDALREGGTALSYTRAGLRERGGRVVGVRLTDVDEGSSRDIDAALVINATGAAAGALAPQANAPTLRPLRGSHFVFPAVRLPLRHAISWPHPRDRRPVFAYPWEGAVLVGTTDLDHGNAGGPPVMSPAEAEYLLEALRFQFPWLRLTAADALSAFAGVRPVVSSGAANPSAESRESALWSGPGLVGVTGGKLTTFRVTARQALAEAARQHPVLAPAPAATVFAAGSERSRLAGRLGAESAAQLRALYPSDAQEGVGDTPYVWAELRWAARHEAIRHLDDLLLRRTRLGLLLPDGGESILGRVLTVCRADAGWNAERTAHELQRYRALWQQRHRPPGA